MSASLKRRRTSSDTYIAVSDVGVRSQVLTNTPTPKRASYLSPTKASLARTNPQLLDTSASAKKNRESEPNRRQSLRDAILGNKSLVPTEEPVAREDSENITSTETVPTEPILSNFRKPTNATVAGKENGMPNTPRHHNYEQHSSSTQSRHSSTPRRAGHSNRFASPKIVPQLVDSPQRNSRRSISAEVELPPTPVQLGKDKLPDRPRGLSSSSPGGREKRRVTARGGNIYSSPLKPRDAVPILSEEADELDEDVEIASGLGDDDQGNVLTTTNGVDAAHVSVAGSDIEENMPASDIKSAQGRDLTTTDPDMIDRLAKLKSLQAEFKVLQEESGRLQSLNAQLNKNRTTNSNHFVADFELVLRDTNLKELSSILPTDQHALFQKHPSPYLSLFTDPTLSMSYETWEKSLGRSQKFVYQTTFAASEPWPADIFTFTLNTLVDWNTDVVEDVTLVNGTKQSEVTKWIQSRLQDSMLRCDAATLVTGIGKYLTASVRRARIWKALVEQKFDTREDEDSSFNENASDNFVMTQKEAVSLLPYLFKTQHGFAPPDSIQQRTRRSLGSAKQLMLTYCINLDWLGRPEIKTEILMTGYKQDTVDAAKQLYSQLEHMGGIVKALNGVRDILGMSSDGIQSDMDQNPSRMRTKRGKARRMTVFN